MLIQFKKLSSIFLITALFALSFCGKSKPVDENPTKEQEKGPGPNETIPTPYTFEGNFEKGLHFVPRPRDIAVQNAVPLKNGNFLLLSIDDKRVKYADLYDGRNAKLIRSFTSDLTGNTELATFRVTELSQNRIAIFSRSLILEGQKHFGFLFILDTSSGDLLNSYEEHQFEISYMMNLSNLDFSISESQDGILVVQVPFASVNRGVYDQEQAGKVLYIDQKAKTQGWFTAANSGTHPKSYERFGQYVFHLEANKILIFSPADSEGQLVLADVKTAKILGVHKVEGDLSSPQRVDFDNVRTLYVKTYKSLYIFDLGKLQEKSAFENVRQAVFGDTEQLIHDSALLPNSLVAYSNSSSVCFFSTEKWDIQKCIFYHDLKTSNMFRSNTLHFHQPTNSLWISAPHHEELQGGRAGGVGSLTRVDVDSLRIHKYILGSQHGAGGPLPKNLGLLGLRFLDNGDPFVGTAGSFKVFDKDTFIEKKSVNSMYSVVSYSIDDPALLGNFVENSKQAWIMGSDKSSLLGSNYQTPTGALYLHKENGEEYTWVGEDLIEKGEEHCGKWYNGNAAIRRIGTKLVSLKNGHFLALNPLDCLVRRDTNPDPNVVAPMDVTLGSTFIIQTH